MNEQAFDPEAFYVQVNATAKERGPLRQDIVRGLKDYFEAVYGYDRYGAETIFQIPERLGEPLVYGYAVARILHDRRISDRTKLGVAARALDITQYGSDGGLPFAFYGALQFLASGGQLGAGDLRYGLVVSAGEYQPFRGMDKPEIVRLFRWLLANNELPTTERAFWAHSLIARHQDQPAAADLVNSLLGSEHLPLEERSELAQAWVNFRQPRLSVEVPASAESYRVEFVAAHMPFWVAHAPSWPSLHMIRLGLVWLARWEPDPGLFASKYMAYHDMFAEQAHGAVAEIIAEHHHVMPENQVRSLIEQGISASGSISTRRRFYRLGSDLFGPSYLQRASSDTAGSVRQWAAKQLQKKS